MRLAPPCQRRYAYEISRMDSDVEHVVRQCRDMCIGALGGERYWRYGLWTQKRIHRVRRMEVYRADAGLQARRPFPKGSGEEKDEYRILAVRFPFLPGSSDGDRVGVYVLRR